MQAASTNAVATEVASKGTKISKQSQQINPEASEVDQAKFSNVSMIVNNPSEIEVQAVEDSVASLLSKTKKGSKQSLEDSDRPTEKKSGV